MISKQLFISFLFLCSFCVPVNAFKPNILNAQGIGVPPLGYNTGPNNNSLEVEDFENIDPGAVTTPTTGGLADDYIFPEPFPLNETEEEIPQGARGHFESDDVPEEQLGDDSITQSNVGLPGPLFPDDGITQSNVGLPDHIFNNMVGRPDNAPINADDADDMHHIPHTHEEVLHHYMKEASVKMHKAWHFALQHPKHIITGAAGIIMMRLGYSWWQRYRTHYHINAVLKKYGKDLSTISPIHTVLLLAAYNKDYDAMHRYVAQYGLDPLQGTDNEWVISALDALCSR